MRTYRTNNQQLATDDDRAGPSVTNSPPDKAFRRMCSPEETLGSIR